MACDMRHKFFKAYCTALIDRGSYFAPTRKRKKKKLKSWFGSGGIRTHAPEETGALNQRLRPLGHATFTYLLRLVLSLWTLKLFV